MSGTDDLDRAGEEWTPPAVWRLAPQEALALTILVANEAARIEDFLDAFDAGAVEPGEPHDVKYPSVVICKARAKLRAFGIKIENIRGRGYRLAPETRAALIAGAERIDSQERAR